MLRELMRWEQALLFAAALLLVAPGLISGLIGLAVASPVLIKQLSGWRSRSA
jgi:UPF0716 family protein affecting phage T7 exclusion